MKKLLAALAAVAAALGAAAIAIRRAMARWARTPDAHDGVASVFPDGPEHLIPTDDGATLRVVEAGQGPTIVLVHGLTSNSDDWGYVARRLVDDGFHVVGVNQRGHGGSTVGTDGFDAPRLAADLATVFEQLEVTDAVLAGHSMGGIASMSFVLDRPDLANRRVTSLVLVATTARTSRSDQRAGIRLISKRNAERMSGDSSAVRLIARGLFGREPSGALIEAAIASGARCPETTRIGASLGLLDYDIRDRLGSIEIPTVVVCGTRDWVTPLYESKAIAAAIPGATLEVVPDAGHLVIWEADELVAELIAARVAMVEVH